MNITPEIILELIHQGESQKVEFKIKSPPEIFLARIFSSFANSEGGIVLFGLSDDGKIIGLTAEEVDETLFHINSVGNSMLPKLFETGVTSIENKFIVFAIIHKIEKNQPPVMTSRGEIFVRKGEATIKMSSTQFNEIVSKIDLKKLRGGKEVILFVAMSFREEEEPALVDYFTAIKRSVKNTKLPITVNRMDLAEGDFEISQKIMDEIDNADIVLSDFTLNPQNVYFELGYARGKKRQIIQTAKKNTKLEFDVRNWKTIFYRNATELEEKLEPEIIFAFKKVTS
jgi:hypothetical protein